MRVGEALKCTRHGGVGELHAREFIYSVGERYRAVGGRVVGGGGRLYGVHGEAEGAFKCRETAIEFSFRDGSKRVGGEVAINDMADGLVAGSRFYLEPFCLEKRDVAFKRLNLRKDVFCPAP